MKEFQPMKLLHLDFHGKFSVKGKVTISLPNFGSNINGIQAN